MGGSGGSGGNGGNPLAEQSTYRLTCMIDTTVLEIPIELSYALDRPYTEGGSADLSFSAAVTFEEPAVRTLIDAGISKIDILAMNVGTWVIGATPSMIGTSFGAAPINDFDLDVDTDSNGAPGPHRLELDTVMVATRVSKGAQEVELGLGLDQVSLLFGDFLVPEECLGPTLVGFAARFPVEPAK